MTKLSGENEALQLFFLTFAARARCKAPSQTLKDRVRFGLTIAKLSPCARTGVVSGPKQTLNTMPRYCSYNTQSCHLQESFGYRDHN